MFWCDQLVEKLSEPQIINDSKTPSGRAHVGALRGPLIHDAIYRTLRARNVPVRYLFGCDDYDPLDEIPYGQREVFEKHLGAPLCNVPPPEGSKAADMAEHFISEFWGVFKELGIEPEYYRMRDVYRSGRFNEAIDAILRQAPVVRRIYKEVSGSERADTWHPFQVVCENCGRIGTTEVTAYDGKEVIYQCRPDLVKWATGCGHRGKISPFDGRGKLPWKLEWCAKWRTFPVTIEGAGQDHSTKGGSRDVAMACLRAIFGQEPPLNCPYDFFLVGGAKMSSSKGVGASARGMADFLPPEVLRFLMIRTVPKHHVNFDTSEVHIIKVFNEFDRLHHRYFHDAKVTAEDRRVYELSQVKAEGDYWAADFQLVTALLQMPHLNAMQELEKRNGRPFTELERRHLDLRFRAAKYWLANYASEEEKTRVHETLPARAQELSQAQRGFLRELAGTLEQTAWTGEALQSAVFSAARLTPIDQPGAFKALYRVLLDREAGPKAGNLLSFLEKDFVVWRCRELEVDRLKMYKETAIGKEALVAWLEKEKPKITRLAVMLDFVPSEQEDGRGCGIVGFYPLMNDGKRFCQRVIFDEEDEEEFQARAKKWIKEVEGKSGVKVGG